jgi:membrane-associated protease RseP (regulator of RpoE activity)
MLQRTLPLIACAALATGCTDLRPTATKPTQDAVVSAGESQPETNAPGWIGIRHGGLRPERAKHRPAQRGAVVLKVYRGSPAARAGLRTHDRIIAFGGRKVVSARQLDRWIKEAGVGRTASLAVRRGKRIIEMRVTPTSRAIAFGGGQSVPRRVAMAGARRKADT